MRKIAVISLKWIKPIAFALVLGVIALAAAGGAAAQASATIPEVTVVLDAGHGGFDGGVVSKDGDRESDLNLAITKRVKKRLEGGGVRVILTRKDEGALGVTKKEDMRKRAEIINASGADAVISIHVNKYTQSYRRGIQVFYGDSGYVQVAKFCLYGQLVYFVGGFDDKKIPAFSAQGDEVRYVARAKFFLSDNDRSVVCRTRGKREKEFSLSDVAYVDKMRYRACYLFGDLCENGIETVVKTTEDEIARNAKSARRQRAVDSDETSVVAKIIFSHISPA